MSEQPRWLRKRLPTAEAPLIFIEDASVRRSIGRFVRSLGMRAETFASAQDLLNSDSVAESACLILDVRMPNMDGQELQRRLGETGQRIPVAFISARASKEEEDRALRSEAVVFLRRPCREGRAAARGSCGSSKRKVEIIPRITMTSLESSVAPRTSRSDDWFRTLRDGHNIN